MQAIYVFEKFSEEGDPIRDMGIDVIEASWSPKILRQKSLEELQELYNRVHGLDNGKVMIDGVMFGTLSSYLKIKFNNAVVAAIKYKRNIKKRDETRSQNFKPGDAIKCVIRGQIVKGYVEFSKRGIVKTDGHARIVAKSIKGVMKVPLEYATKLTPAEKRQFDIEFQEAQDKKQKEMLERKLRNEQIFNGTKYAEMKKQYDELMKKINQ